MPFVALKENHCVFHVQGISTCSSRPALGSSSADKNLSVQLTMRLPLRWSVTASELQFFCLLEADYNVKIPRALQFTTIRTKHITEVGCRKKKNASHTLSLVTEVLKLFDNCTNADYTCRFGYVR
jgi:hypothetical protein